MGIPVLRLWGCLHTQHPILDRWDQQRFVSHTYSQPRKGRRTPCTRQGHVRVALSEQSDKPKVIGASRGWGALGFHRRIWLSYWNNSLDWQRTEAYYSGISMHCARSPWWGEFGEETSLTGTEHREVMRPVESLLIAPDANAAHSVRVYHELYIPCLLHDIWILK